MDDVTPEEIEAARIGLWRGLAWHGAFLLAALAMLASLLWSGVRGPGYVVLLSVLVVVAALLAYQVWLLARDLRSAPVETEGVVRKKWQRAELVIAWQSFFMQIERRIFNLDARVYLLVEEGMRVRVVHFPRTLEIVRVEAL